MQNKLFVGLIFLFTSFSGLTQDSTRTYRNLEMALREPDKVVVLDLSRQKLDEFPMEILQFKNLKELYMSKTKLRVIPAEIGQLTELEIVDFSKNKLLALPSELFNCLKLKKIIANQNEINAIPKEISKLQELVYLDLWSNDLAVVPEEIKECKKLKEVDLRVIEMTKAEQERIRELLPETEIHFSPYCSCSH